MPVIFEVFEPDNKTYDRTPRLRWTYAGQQKGFMLKLEKNKGIAGYDLVYAQDTHLADTSKYIDLIKPGGGNLAFGTYNACLYVLNQYDTWDNYPIAIYDFALSGNRVTLGFSGNAHAFSVGDYVLVEGVGAGYNGIFDVDNVDTSTLSYNYTAANYSTLPALGIASRGATLQFQIVPVNEKLYYWQENLNTTGNAASIAEVILTEGTGAYRVNNYVTVTTKDAHGLSTGSSVYIKGTTGAAGTSFDGLHNVVNAGNSTFGYYQFGPDDLTGTGGTVMDMGFEDWPVQTDVDITNDSERVKIVGSATTTISSYAANGYYYLRCTSPSINTAWGFITYTALSPSGTAIEIVARVADTETALTAATYSTNLPSGTKLDLTGRILEVRIKLTSNTPTLDQTPNIKELQISYFIPGSAGGTQTASWTDFKVSDPSLAFAFRTKSATFGNTLAAMLDVESTIDNFASSGYIILRHDSKGLNEWRSYGLLGAIPDATGCQLETQYRHFNKLSQAEDTSWVAGQTFTAGSNYPYMHTFSSPYPITLKRYMDVLVNFVPSTDIEHSPSVTEVDFLWTKVVEGVARYFYTTQVRLPSNLESMILVPNVQEPDGCEMTYGITFDGSSDFENDYAIVAPNSLAQIASGERNVKVGVRLFSASLSDAEADIPILNELAYQFNTSNKDVFYLNSDMP